MDALAGAGRLVLVAAGDAPTRDALDELLSAEGFGIRHAHDVSLACAWLSRAPLAALLVDFGLAGGGALPVLRHADRVRPGVPAALLTNSLPLDAERRANDLGAAAFLNRPLDLDRVLLVMGTLIAPAIVTGR